MKEAPMPVSGTYRSLMAIAFLLIAGGCQPTISLSASPDPALVQSLPADQRYAIRVLSDAFVQIVTGDDAGSGIMVGERVFLTAAHVFENAEFAAYGNPLGVVYGRHFSSRPTLAKSFANFEVIEVGPYTGVADDYAVLGMSGIRSIAPVSYDGRSPVAPGEKVFIMGTSTAGAESVEEAHDLFERATVHAVTNGALTLRVDRPLAEHAFGASGGPVVRWDGSTRRMVAIGILVSGTSMTLDGDGLPVHFFHASRPDLDIEALASEWRARERARIEQLERDLADGAFGGSEPDSPPDP